MTQTPSSNLSLTTVRKVIELNYYEDTALLTERKTIQNLSIKFTTSDRDGVFYKY